MTERRYPTVYRVRWRRPGARSWTGTRFYVMRTYAMRQGGKAMALGFDVELAEGELGAFSVIYSTEEGDS